MINWLRANELLLETDVQVNPDLEITGVQKHLDGSYPILFKNVKGYPHLECVTNLYAKWTSFSVSLAGMVRATAHAGWRMQSRTPSLP